ncbi:MAG: hypothetical protein OXR68_03225 [Alphaproteobacteria bacterium]|nr:hypothetical protein [Alphaproteobacteria bacterium]MDD9919617.1 hypothetical protein [Alphaproteobacteria bacterium]
MSKSMEKLQPILEALQTGEMMVTLTVKWFALAQSNTVYHMFTTNNVATALFDGSDPTCPRPFHNDKVEGKELSFEEALTLLIKDLDPRIKICKELRVGVAKMEKPREELASVTLDGWQVKALIR